MIYAVGDIHGQLAQLDRALALIAADGGGPIVFLGDYVDRGPDSRGVIDRLLELEDTVCLLGNHDRMFRRFLDDGTLTDPAVKSGLAWPHARLGGAETLESYGVSVPEAHRDMTAACLADVASLRREVLARVPAAHRAFLAGLRPMHRVGELLFAHGGIRPGVVLADQVEDDLIWMREPFLSDPRDHGVLVVHGHTALEAPQRYGNRVNLDGGAGYGRPLCPVVFEGRHSWLLTEAGRVAL